MLPAGARLEFDLFSFFSSAGPRSAAESVACLTQDRRPEFDTRSGHILPFLLRLIQEGQLSVTGGSMCTKYW